MQNKSDAIITIDTMIRRGKASATMDETYDSDEDAPGELDD